MLLLIYRLLFLLFSQFLISLSRPRVESNDSNFYSLCHFLKKFHTICLQSLRVDPFPANWSQYLMEGLLSCLNLLLLGLVTS